MECNKFEISIEDLKNSIDVILDHITNDLGINKIELDQDFYWQIPEDSLHLLDQKPENLTMGSLIDDRDFLQTVLSDKECGLSLMLLHVAPLLRYVALKVGQ